MNRFGLAWLLGIAMAMAAPLSAHAAESYDNCTGFITTLPATIASPGTWCLKQDLTTAITGGAAILVNSNNVTVDCNNFRLGGLAAGAGTSAYGIEAINRANVAVRRCSIRGFYYGVLIYGSTGSSGHLVEDNRLDGNTFQAIYVEGDGSTIRHNLVFDTGGTTINGAALGIHSIGTADVLDNTVSGVAATSGTNANAMGMEVDTNTNGVVRGNRVRGLAAAGTGYSLGIYTSSVVHLSIRDNDLGGDDSAGSEGLLCSDTNSSARDNTINSFLTEMAGCNDDGGNVFRP